MSQHPPSRPPALRRRHRSRRLPRRARRHRRRRADDRRGDPHELADQRESLKLIASENYASPAALLTMGTWLSDKYAEGTVGHRFYAGCQNIDTVEQRRGRPRQGPVRRAARLRAAALGHRRQPRRLLGDPRPAGRGARRWPSTAPSTSTTSADADWEQLRRALGNQRALGMSLDAGGHLTHGFRPNICGKMFDQSSYGTDPETGLLDYDAVRAHRPRVQAAGARSPATRPTPARSTSPRCARSPTRSAPCCMVDMAHFAGLVAGKVFTGDFDPVPHAHVTTTTTHKSLRGPRGGMVLCQPEFADAVDRGCPMVLGGPLGHVMAAKAVALAEARRPVVPDLRPGGRRQRRRPGRRADAPRRPPRHRRHREPPRADRRLGVRAHRPPGRVRAARRRHRHQPQLDPARPERRLVHLGHPHRHAGAHLARLRRRRLRPGRRADRRRAGRHRRRPQPPSGGLSKAKYAIADGVADRVHAGADELLAANPLYPGLDVSL